MKLAATTSAKDRIGCERIRFEFRAHLGVVNREHSIVLMRASGTWHEACSRSARACFARVLSRYSWAHLCGPRTPAEWRGSGQAGHRKIRVEDSCAHCTRCAERPPNAEPAIRWPLPLNFASNDTDDLAGNHSRKHGFRWHRLIDWFLVFFWQNGFSFIYLFIYYISFN